MDTRTHTHGANYNLPPASRAGDNKRHLLILVAITQLSTHLAIDLHLQKQQDLPNFNTCEGI